jgi:PncC family amidohydrolase
MTDSHSAQVGSALVARGETLALAESCTGGLIGHLVTESPGSSAYFIGGVISYSNQVKQEQLMVPAAVLKAHGAVSQATAEAMAAGVRQLLKTDYGLAVTGIAGPTGGSEEKPIGLTWMALAHKGGVRARKHLFEGDRTHIKRLAAEAALEMLLLQLNADG